MGYTHYFNNKTGPTPAEWETLCEAARLILNVYAAVINSGVIKLHTACETFVLSSGPVSFGFCKTRRRSGDAEVCAVLLVASELGWSVSSDGDWDEWGAGRELFEKALGRPPLRPASIQEGICAAFEPTGYGKPYATVGGEGRRSGKDDPRLDQGGAVMLDVGQVWQKPGEESGRQIVRLGLDPDGTYDTFWVKATVHPYWITTEGPVQQCTRKGWDLWARDATCVRRSSFGGYDPARPHAHRSREWLELIAERYFRHTGYDPALVLDNGTSIDPGKREPRPL